MTPRPPLDEVLALFQATVAAEGVTTGAGNGTGTSIVDAGLAGSGANSFFSMLMVLYPGQPRLVDSMDITGFTNGTGEVTLSTAYKGVAAPIPAGVPYKIVTFRFVPAEVAAIKAVVDAILVDTSTTLEGKLDALALICTAARGLLIDRLSIITAGGAGELTPARAALLSNLDATVSTRSTLTQAQIISDTTPFLGASIAATLALVDSKVMGRSQIKATTIDLNQVAGTYGLFTGATQDVVVEKLIIRMSGGAVAGAVTSISIQTNDATPQVFVNTTDGAVANLTNQNQLGYDGAIMVKAAKQIQLTIAGGAAGVARVCDVVAIYRAVVSGGYLA